MAGSRTPRKQKVSSGGVDESDAAAAASTPFPLLFISNPINSSNRSLSLSLAEDKPGAPRVRSSPIFDLKPSERDPDVSGRRLFANEPPSVLPPFHFWACRQQEECGGVGG